MSHADVYDIGRGHNFRKHRHKNNKKNAVFLQENDKKKTAVTKVFTSRLLWGAYIYCEILSVRYAYASVVDAEGFACKRLGARTAWSLTLHDRPRQEADWERIERGGDIPGVHSLYKVTYIRHLKNKGLSVTKLTKKSGLFVTKVREFSVKMGLLVTCTLNICGVLTQKNGVFG